MSFTAKDVMGLRQKTGLGMMDCKKALAETNGDSAAAEPCNGPSTWVGWKLRF